MLFVHILEVFYINTTTYLFHGKSYYIINSETELVLVLGDINAHSI